MGGKFTYNVSEQLVVEECGGEKWTSSNISVRPEQHQHIDIPHEV